MRTGRLPFEVFLGLRYLRARGHRTNLSLFVWIGIGGVFLGVSALIVVLAVMTGFQTCWCHAVKCRSQSSTDCRYRSIPTPSVAISVTSTPVWNARPSPVCTMARTSG